MNKLLVLVRQGYGKGSALSLYGRNHDLAFVQLDDPFADR